MTLEFVPDFHYKVSLAYFDRMTSNIAYERVLLGHLTQISK